MNFFVPGHLESYTERVLTVSTSHRNNFLVSNLRKNSYLRIGQRLAVCSKTTTSKSGVSSTASSAKGQYHTVRKGENLWTISQKYKGVSAEDIKRANNLKGNAIQPGQKLKIPAA